jgi:glycosyltransferase involved in cell wall biosynthesis
LLAVAATAAGAIFAWWAAPFIVAGLNPPEDPARLAAAIAAALDDPAAAQASAERLAARVRELFSQDAMVEGVLAGYAAAITAKFMQSR